LRVAPVLPVNPTLIVCGERIPAPDDSMQVKIVKLLRGLQRECGARCLFITDDIALLESIADHLAVMRAGRSDGQGDSANVLQRPEDDDACTLLVAVLQLCLPPAGAHAGAWHQFGERLCCNVPTAGSPGSRDEPLGSCGPGTGCTPPEARKCLSVLMFSRVGGACPHQVTAPVRQPGGSRGFPQNKGHGASRENEFTSR